MKTAVLSVIYYEPEWLHTCIALSRLKEVPVFFVDRYGVDGLAPALNKGFAEHRLARFEYVWFVTNVLFDPDLLPALEGVLDSNRKIAAAHPAFNSDHKHLQYKPGPLVRTVPFVEFTAPLVRTNTFTKHPLDNGMPYTGHDLDWGWRVRQAGGICVAVNLKNTIKHTYVRNMSEHPTTKERRKKRAACESATREILAAKYGDDWFHKLRYSGPLD